MATSAAQKAAATRKRRTAARKAATTRKRRAAGKKAAITRKRRTSVRNTAPVPSIPSVVPMISYEDGIAALEWLRKAFGFREMARLTTPDGKLSHGEMEAGKGLIMLASPTPEYAVRNIIGRFANRHASGLRCPGLSMACSSTWTTWINISNEQRPQVR